jgi:uncharacterized protein YqfB (UPF0267 family)
MIEKTALRESLFRHLDGLVVAPIAVALQNSGILKTILDKKSATVSHLAQEFQANQGYLNIALRALASQGFLNYEVDNATTQVTITTNENSQIAFSLFNKYEGIVKVLEKCDIFTEIEINSNNFHHLEDLFKQFKNQNNTNLPSECIRISNQQTPRRIFSWSISSKFRNDRNVPQVFHGNLIPTRRIS